MSENKPDELMGILEKYITKAILKTEDIPQTSSDNLFPRITLMKTLTKQAHTAIKELQKREVIGEAEIFGIIKDVTKKDGRFSMDDEFDNRLSHAIYSAMVKKGEECHITIALNDYMTALRQKAEELWGEV